MSRKILYLTSRLAQQRIPAVVKHDYNFINRAVTALGFKLDIQPWEDVANSCGHGSNKWLAIWPRPWFYHENAKQFQDFVLNSWALKSKWLQPRSVILNNMDKRYMLSLQKRGIDTIPSKFLSGGDISTQIEQVLHSTGWNDILIKPSIGANSYRTQKLSWNKESDRSNVLTLSKQILSDSDLLIQPVEKDLTTFGEINMVYVGDELMFGVKKLVKTSSDGTVRPAAETLSQAQIVPIPYGSPFRIFADKVMQVSKQNLNNGQLPLVSRVDIVANPSHVRLVELEQLEPYLFWELQPDKLVSKVSDKIREMIAEN